jgi:hypothetical protein
VRADEDELKAELATSTLAMQQEPDNTVLQERCGLAKERLDQLQSRRIVGRKICSRLRW